MNAEERSDKLLALVERIAVALEGRKLTQPNLPAQNISKTIPNCPLCGKPMILRKRKSDNSDFWGCRAFPECKGTCNGGGTPTKQPKAEFKNSPDFESPIDGQDDVPF